MITSKQRARLRAMANPLETIGQIGKGGITDNVIQLADEALTARELIKLRVLETCEHTAREAAQELARRTNAEIVQVIGYRFVLYRKNEQKPKERQIQL